MIAQRMRKIQIVLVNTFDRKQDVECNNRESGLSQLLKQARVD